MFGFLDPVLWRGANGGLQGQRVNREFLHSRVSRTVAYIVRETKGLLSALYLKSGVSSSLALEIKAW